MKTVAVAAATAAAAAGGLTSATEKCERKRGQNSRIPTSILLIKVITLRTESANLILIDVKLGGMEKARLGV